MADPRTINYAGGQKIDNTEMVSKKIDDAIQPVASDLADEITRSTAKDQDLQDQVDKLNEDLGDISNLETVDKSSAVAAINELVQKIPETEEAPTEGSEKIAKSGGTWDAIRFASVKVGETMYWHLQDDSSPEDREVHSDNPFVFNFRGQEMSVETHDGHVQLCVLKDIPDGWHALDGKAELLAADYPDLAAFMPENVTTDGKIWLPYVQHKIIKVKY